MECWREWREMLFDHTLPSPEWKPEEIEFVFTPAVKNAITQLVCSIHLLADKRSNASWTRQEIHDWLEKLERACERLSWNVRGRSEGT